MTIQPAELANTFRALSDPNRLRALLLLRREELTVGELREVLGVAQSTASTLLRLLMDAELVEARREGRHAFYRGRPGVAVVDQAIGDVAPAAADLEALERIRASRLGDGDAPAGHFERNQAPGRSWRTLARSLLQLTDFGAVADLGVGTGELTLLLARSADVLYAVDAEPAALQALERTAAEMGIENVKTIAGDFEELSLPEPVDLVTISLSLAVAEKPRRVLAGAFSALRPGGRVWITDLVKHEQSWTRTRFGHRWLGFAPELVASFLREAGFEAVTVTQGSRERRPPHFQTLIAVGRRPAATK